MTKNIETIHATLVDFQVATMAELSKNNINEDQTKKIRKGIPSNLQQYFDQNPLAINRLLVSWDYVNQAPFDKKPNVKEFLRGDRANWALIGAKEYFQRDIEEEVYDDLLDFATSTTNRPKVIIVLAPAGYGVTTFLMTLAAKLARERAGSIFMLKHGRQFLEGDVEFAATSLPDRPFFFINNAADFSARILNSVYRLRNIKKGAMFILGERLNEWRMGYGKLRGKEYQIDSLSDSEIHRLLDYLEKNNELNKLANLSRDLQFISIQKGHGKELLVAMREATEGKNFDAILEDEFRGLQNPVSQKLYLIVSCFHMHGAYVRDGVIEKILAMPITEIYNKIRESTEGVIIFDKIDEENQIYGARTRHRIIANIVWERCRRNEDSDSIIQLSLNSLNLNYKSDVSAFEHFVRSDQIVDSIKSLEGKIKYFDTACTKDPNSPYVRQHYSRMLLRSDHAELGLSQIDEAITMNPNIRVLYHTKGMILMDLAHKTESRELARRWLIQSENCFKQGINIYKRDEYCYQGLARLYTGWALRSLGSEFTDYLSKAEEVISEGLKFVKVRSGLWLESSRIQQILGNEPKRLNFLEQAVKESPGSVVARYLLARAYRKSNQAQKAVNILDHVIRNNINEFRCFVEYALSALILGKPYAEVIGILEISSLYGYSDPRYLSILGGLYFLNGEFSKSKTIFDKSLTKNFTAEEINSIQFRPPDRNDVSQPLQVTGKVVQVTAGYSFIQTPGYPPILCPASKYNSLIIKKDLDLLYNVGFTPKGAVAYDPQNAN